MFKLAELFSNDTIKAILDRYKLIWSINHALSLLGWDLETYMPEQGVKERSIATSQLSVLAHKLLIDESFVRLVDKASDMKDLNDYERGVVRVLKREIEKAKKIPPKLVEELSRVTSEATVVWRNAKAENNFKVFEPYLAKIVDLVREVADKLGYDEHPYDALLDLYEEGLKTRDFDRVVEVITPRLKKILDRVRSEGYYPESHPLEDREYRVEALKRVNKSILELIGYDPKTLRLDVSAHPFTTSMGVKDVRITTRYEGKDFRRSILAVIHEYGHALYELQIDEKLATTPLAKGVSLGIHESQSRFWENIVGRSRDFVDLIYSIVAEELEYVREYTPEELYRYFNIVRPGLIRVDADEVTYNLHIVVRFELEKLLVKGEIKVSDLPELWAEQYEDKLGIKPKTYSEGVLQDIHWSGGSIGYFPTYTIGTIVAAQIKHAMESDLGPLSEVISSKKFDSIKTWLREKIHRWGSTYDPKTLMKKSLGEELNPERYIEYLESKYIKI